MVVVVVVKVVGGGVFTMHLDLKLYKNGLIHLKVRPFWGVEKAEM